MLPIIQRAPVHHRRRLLTAPVTAGLIAVLFAACGPPTPDPGQPGQTTQTTQTTQTAQPTPSPTAEVAATPPSPCLASAAWITSPTMPSEVAAQESFCDFYQFSWQWFLAQVSPARASEPTGDRVFETNRLYDPTVKSGQCAAAAITGRAAAAKRLKARVVKPKDFEHSEADGNALYDQNKNILYYSLWYSADECKATQTGFTAGTMELKVAWKILPAPDPTYFTIKTTSLPAAAGAPAVKGEVTLGLVGFHLVNWTSKHPEMIWATFEHKGNAPDCDGSSAAPASGWSFTSADAAKCLTTNPQPGAGPPNSACASFKLNTPNSFKGAPPPTATPNNVCRQYPYGNQPGTSVNGNDNTSNLAAIAQLNEQLVGPKGLLTQLPADNPMAVWKNYEMIGGIWTKGGASSGNSPVPSTSGGKVVPGDPNSPQRGSLELTNMTMETFQQGDTSPIPNCFGCHNFVTTAQPGQPGPLDVSHICTQLFGADSSGNCLVASAKAAAKKP
jgi:hypothetical protein